MGGWVSVCVCVWVWWGLESSRLPSLLTLVHSPLQKHFMFILKWKSDNITHLPKIFQCYWRAQFKHLRMGCKILFELALSWRQQRCLRVQTWAGLGRESLLCYSLGVSDFGHVAYSLPQFFFFFLVCKIVVMESSTTWGCVRSEWKVNYLVYTISTQVILAVVITVSPAFKKYYLALWLTHDNVRVYGVQHVDLISRNLSLAAFFLSHQLHALPLSPEHGRPRLPPCFH